MSKSSLTTLELHLLDMACGVVTDGFAQLNRFGTTYLVGTAGDGGTYRDVDVRTILHDEDFDRLFGGPSGSKLWELMCLTIGFFLRAQTGLPVDYQIQRLTQANEKYPDGKRNPIGRGRIYAGGGDATKFVPDTETAPGMEG